MALKPINLNLSADVRSALLSAAAAQGISESRMAERLIIGQLVRRGALLKRSSPAKAKGEAKPVKQALPSPTPSEPYRPTVLAGSRLLLS